MWEVVKKGNEFNEVEILKSFGDWIKIWSKFEEFKLQKKFTVQWEKSRVY